MSGTAKLPVTLAEIEADPVRIIETVMARVPSLSSVGFDAHPMRYPSKRPFDENRAVMTLPYYVAHFIRAAQWLTQAPRTARVVRRFSSYGWKHVAEAWHRERPQGQGGDSYIMNGMFLAACYAMGFEVRRVPGSPNAYVGISQKARKAAPWL